MNADHHLFSQEEPSQAQALNSRFTIAESRGEEHLNMVGALRRESEQSLRVVLLLDRYSSPNSWIVTHNFMLRLIVLSRNVRLSTTLLRARLKLITKFWCEVYGRLEIFQPTCRYCFGFAVSSYNHLQPFS